MHRSRYGVAAGAVPCLLAAAFMAACVPEAKKPAAVAVPGAEFVGAEQCATCHEAAARKFRLTAHGKVALKSAGRAGEGCESCHGPGSLHVQNAGDKRLIARRSAAACLACHSNARAEFNLHSRHPVPEGKMSCADCHSPHEPDARAAVAKGRNEKCLACHAEKRGPWTFEHEAVSRDGCTSCHTPHGSVHAKLLLERDYNLCLKCHYSGTQFQSIGHYAHKRALNPSSQGAQYANCSGCHRGVHGSNFSKELRSE